jgi:integrase
MKVQKVIMPATGAESWTVLGDDWATVGPVEQYLAYLSAIERSPGTVRAYAFGLKLWSEFLAGRGLDWDKVGVDAVAQFVGWLRAPADNVVVLDAGTARRSAATVNRHLAAVFGLYDYHARTGLKVASDLVAWKRTGRGSYKSFLHHVTKGRPVPTRPVKLAVPRQVPRTLTDEQVLALLAACGHLRDRFFLALLAETGMRAGQALGLRHSDFVSRDREVRVVPRDDNANGARAKTRSVHVLPVSTALVRLYSEYMHTEYGALASDYVFVNLWSEPKVWVPRTLSKAVDQDFRAGAPRPKMKRGPLVLLRCLRPSRPAATSLTPWATRPGCRSRDAPPRGCCLAPPSRSPGAAAS